MRFERFVAIALPVTIAAILVLSGRVGRTEGAQISKPAGQAANSGGPSEAIKAAVANRLPTRILKDSYPSYSAVAVDEAHNEVILAAENMLSLMIHDRTQNTPPTVRSEPRRMIHGLNTDLEFVCGVYVDPASGDVYG